MRAWVVAVASLAAGCAVVAGLQQVSVDPAGADPDASVALDASLADTAEAAAQPDQDVPPQGDGGVLPVAFDAAPVDAKLDVVIDAPLDAPYVASWSTGQWGGCSDTLCGGTECRSVTPATFKTTPPDAPSPNPCQTCSPPCCNCPDLGSNWFYNNASGSAQCQGVCTGGCIAKYREAITEQQTLGCVLRQTTCLKGFGCP
jgi:hypothetical protein